MGSEKEVCTNLFRAKVFWTNPSGRVGLGKGNNFVASLEMYFFVWLVFFNTNLRLRIWQWKSSLREFTSGKGFLNEPMWKESIEGKQKKGAHKLRPRLVFLLSYKSKNKLVPIRPTQWTSFKGGLGLFDVAAHTAHPFLFFTTFVQLVRFGFLVQSV